MAVEIAFRLTVCALIWASAASAQPAKEPAVQTTRSSIPAATRAHLATVLEPDLPAGTVEYLYVSLTRLPTGNYRVRIAEDGALRVDRHRGQDRARRFDGAWPKTPQGRLTAPQQATLTAALERLAEHPGYEALPGGRGGAVHVLRWRAGGALQVRIFENTTDPLFDQIYAWAAPHL